MKKGSIFSQVPVANVARNMFDLSHEVKMSMKFGFIYPCLVMDCLPGDTIRDQMTAFLRFAPMLSPIYHRIDVKTDFFFVPNRLLQTSWEDFITGGRNGDLNPVWPYFTPSGIAASAIAIGGTGIQYMGKSTLWDYLGLPVVAADLGAAANWSTEQITSLPFKAYAKIWNDYYRDPSLEAEIDIDAEVDGDNSPSSVPKGWLQLRRRAWERDYFTSALPWAQRGAQVLMPLSATGFTTKNSVLDPGAKLVQAVGGGNAALGAMSAIAAAGGTSAMGTGGQPLELLDQRVTVANASTTLNDLRTATALQKWMENNARGGGRYVEQILVHFNTRVPDYRLQRAEYLGGGRQPVTISEVLAQAESVGVPVGDMAGHGISVGKSNRFTYRCQEHGIVMGIISVIPRTAYQQGLDRMWSRKTRYEYAFPEFANLGEQAILSKELLLAFDAVNQVNNGLTFGYIPRYAEYKFKNDRVAGDFRTNLDFWHLGRIFTARPTLTANFTTMYEHPGNEATYRRIFAVQDGTDYLWVQLYHSLTAKRPLPYFGVPSLNA